MTKQIAFPETASATTAVRIALDAINAFAKDAAKKGGIDELTQKLNTAREGLTAHMFKIAVAAVDLAGNDMGLAVSYFKDLTTRAQVAYQEAHKGADGKLLPISGEDGLIPSWAPIKSLVMSGMDKKGLNPTEHKVADFMAKARKKAGKAPAVQGNTNPATAAVASLGEQTQTVFGQLCKELAELPKELDAACTDILAKAVTAIRALKAAQVKDEEGEQPARQAA